MTAATNNYNIFPFSQGNLNEYLNSAQGRYLFNYLSDLNAKTCVLEEKYIDKGHIIDYQKFYSRSFEDCGRFTKRVHFFADEFSTTKFKNSLENNNISYLQNSYLGFAVIRPIEGRDGNPLIGRTLLKTYPDDEKGKKRVFCRVGYKASLFGIPLSVGTLPYQAQDQGVAACATIALWTALHPFGDIFGTPRHSPVEITEIATLFPSLSRQFPSSGLTIVQMINYIRSIGLDVEVIRIRPDINPDIIPSAIKAYTEANLPLIASLILKKDNHEEGRHATVITGYRYDSMGEVKELYVHDDQIGPYSRVKPNGGFKFWKNEWSNKGYKVELEQLLIPIYPKIRLIFANVYPFFQAMKERTHSFGHDFGVGLYLISIQEYKEQLLNQSIKNKEEILTMPLSRFLWIMRTYYKNHPLWDSVYDSTSVYPKKLTTVYYKLRF